MKSPTALLTLCIVVLVLVLDDSVEGVTAQKESSLTAPARKDSQSASKSSVNPSELSIPAPIYIPFEKSMSSDKKLFQMDTTVDDKKDKLDINKEKEKLEESFTTTTESNSNIGVTEVPEASIMVAVAEPSEDQNKKCSETICKIPPNDAWCSPLSEIPGHVVSILGATANCCPFLICTRADSSFFAHYAGAHVEPRQDTLLPIPPPNPPQMVMTQFFAGTGIPPWQNNQFGGFRPPPPPFPSFGPTVNDRNVRPFAAELQISMGRRVELPLSMSFLQQPPFQQQSQQVQQSPMPFQQFQPQAQPQRNIQLQPTMDRDPQHPSFSNDIFRERRSGVFNSNPFRNQFLPSGYPGAGPAAGGFQFQPEYRAQQPLANYF